MKEREIQVTADQIHKLITEVRALPSTPIGDHLSDDEFIDYTMETLEPQQIERIDAHRLLSRVRDRDGAAGRSL